MDIRRELDVIIASISDPRDQRILHARFLEPENGSFLYQLRSEFGLTGERMRQLESLLRKKLIEKSSTFSPELSVAITQFQQNTGDSIKLQKSFELLSQAGFTIRTYPELDNVSRLFLFYAGPYCVWREYLVKVVVLQKLSQLRRLIWLRLKERTLTMHEADKIGRRTGVNSPRLLSQILFDLKAKYRDIYHLIDGRWEYRPRVTDRALLFLEEAGHPIDLEVLAEKCRTTYHNLVNRISSDHRIVRVGRRSYGLRKWGYVPYTGIVGVIHEVLEESGGQAEIEYVVDKASKQYDISATSVKHYSKVHRDFILENGLLRVRNSQDLTPDPTLSDLGQVSGCLYIDGQPAVRIRINDFLWKGSGWATPKAWALKMGGHPGEKILLGNKDRGVILTWLGKEPSLGSMRKLALQDGWPNEGFAFIILSPTGLLSLTMPLPPGPQKDPKVIVKAVSSLFAMPECQEYPPSTPFWLTLGSRLGLSPDQSEADFVLKRLKSRRDRLLAPYLKMLRSVRYKI